MKNFPFKSPGTLLGLKTFVAKAEASTNIDADAGVNVGTLADEVSSLSYFWGGWVNSRKLILDGK